MRRFITAKIAVSVSSFASALVLSNCSTVEAPKEESPPLGTVREDVVFMTQIKPLLELRCLECHNDKDAREYAGLSLQTREAAMTTGRSGGVLKPGDPDGSLLLRVLSYGHDHPVGMPPSPDKLWDDKKKLIHDWIEDGAVWPDPPRGRLIRPQDVWE